MVVHGKPLLAEFLQDCFNYKKFCLGIWCVRDFMISSISKLDLTMILGNFQMIILPNILGSPLFEEFGFDNDPWDILGLFDILGMWFVSTFDDVQEGSLGLCWCLGNWYEFIMSTIRNVSGIWTCSRNVFCDCLILVDFMISTIRIA